MALALARAPALMLALACASVSVSAGAGVGAGAGAGDIGDAGDAGDTGDASDVGDAGEREEGKDACPFDVDDDEDPFCHIVAIIGLELLLEFDVAKSALRQAEEWAQLDALLRLEARAAEGYWGLLISPNSAIFRQKREATARDAAERNDPHRPRLHWRAPTS